MDISLLTRKIFVKDCFGVEIEESLTPHGRCTIYQCDGDLAEPEVSNIESRVLFFYRYLGVIFYMDHSRRALLI